MQALTDRDLVTENTDLAARAQELASENELLRNVVKAATPVAQRFAEAARTGVGARDFQLEITALVRSLKDVKVKI